MTARRLAPCVLAMCIAASARSAAQTPARLVEQVDLIVRVQPSKGTPGSGLIIAVENDRIRILTARHVVEAGVAMPETALGDMAARRPCINVPVDVVFKFAPSERLTSTVAECSDSLDAAIIEVPRPAAFSDAVPRLSAQRSNADLEGYEVFLAGMAQGANWTVLPGAVSSKAPDNLVIRGVGIGPGFSGGAVFDREFGFAGMIVRAGGSIVNAVPAFALNQWLKVWGVRTTHIEGAPTQPDNPHFAGSRSPGVREENARNAIRRYRGAFASMEPALVAKAYPAIGKQPVRLFGDASKVELDLNNCSDIDPSAVPEQRSITCAFALHITRKTGPPFNARSCDYTAVSGKSSVCTDADTCRLGRMVFALRSSGHKDDPFEWEITNISTGGATACADSSR